MPRADSNLVTLSEPHGVGARVSGPTAATLPTFNWPHKRMMIGHGLLLLRRRLFDDMPPGISFYPVADGGPSGPKIA